MHPSSDRSPFYEAVSQEALQKLLDFRRSYPYQSVEAAGQTWRLIDTGTPRAPMDSPPLVALAGATTIAEAGFQSIAHFALGRRVIAPDYPPLYTLKDLFGGLIELIDQLGVGVFDLIGGSYGGWMAQSLVRAYPDRVRRMALTAIGPPDAENSRRLAKMRPVFRLLPMGMLRTMLNRSFARLDNSQEFPDMALLWALAKEALAGLQRRDLLALIGRLIDQSAHYTFSAQDLQDWPGEILLVFGSEDPASPLEKRQAMQALYPQAQMVVFEGGQHGIALTHQKEYFAAIDAFLTGST
jgi:pimeloyl-ACP methyl ester carboxylesterase